MPVDGREFSRLRSSEKPPRRSDVRLADRGSLQSGNLWLFLVPFAMAKITFTIQRRTWVKIFCFIQKKKTPHIQAFLPLVPQRIAAANADPLARSHLTCSAASTRELLFSLGWTHHSHDTISALRLVNIQEPRHKFLRTFFMFK